MEKKLKNIQTFEQHTDKNLNISDVSKRLNKVHVIIESKGVDYHGSYREIVEIYANIEDAKKKIKELLEENNNYDIDYFIDTYNVL
ncbi:MAG: hypothetical protein PHN54_03230 [Bacilli bacterium]|jgi:galactitol-specific phosphotransferase system IIB component|nr:hypothetical protein [Bacilli bacterium]